MVYLILGSSLLAEAFLGKEELIPRAKQQGLGNSWASEHGLQSALTTYPRSSVESLRSRHGRSIPARSQLDHAFPAPDGSTGSPKDTSLVDFVFARTTRESVGHRRTRQRHGSGP